MPVHTVKCPECRTTLKSSRPIPAGKLLTCPKCDVLFAAPKPVVLDAEVIEEVEVVEDVDVIEDVEVVDVNALWQTPVMPLLDPVLSNPQSPFAKLKQATNASTRDVCQRLVVGFRLNPSGKPDVTAVVKSAAAIDADKLGTAFSGTKSSVSGRTVYKLPAAGAMSGTLAVPNKHIAIFAEMPDEPLGRVLKSSGRSSVLSGDMAT